ncbi:juvenile hormone acid O-methyltransferase-like [Phlebotomus argentipes]|uniref:juvenile hormone acid O-methyltransferase-like n=1 Tax=Phlebotomus argentipes TaxID=94469 RepID=UPI00289372E6|nr:juvenile hormone acid O-methyltransferase-like [Phlebotomus argentipes]
MNSFQYHEYNPQKYAFSSDVRCKIVQSVLDSLFGSLKWRGGERVMDIGCGIGDVTRRCFLPLLPDNFQRLVCADFSPVMLEAAKLEFRGIDRVDFLQMDIGKNVEDSLKGTFDRIFSSFCLMYVQDQKQVFKNIFDLLTPGGDCVIMFMRRGAITETGIQLVNTPKWKDRLKHYREVFVFPYREDPDPVATLENLLKSVGFQEVSVEKEDFNHVYPSTENFRETLMCLPDFPNNLSEDEKDDLVDDQVDLGSSFNIIRPFRDETKPMKEIPYQNLIIYARKPEA